MHNQIVVLNVALVPPTSSDEDKQYFMKIDFLNPHFLAVPGNALWLGLHDGKDLYATVVRAITKLAETSEKEESLIVEFELPLPLGSSMHALSQKLRDGGWFRERS